MLEVLLELKSKQGDIAAEFLDANLKEGENVFVEMDLKFQKKGKVLMLKKTLCGLCQAPCAFWRHLVEKLEACGMSQFKLDPCSFIGKKALLMTCYSGLRMMHI